MTINEHKLIHVNDAGNGYHGNCEHCGVALVTDLGYSSWDNLKCIDRELTAYNDVPNEILDYVRFFGLVWDKNRKVFSKPYDEEEFTIDQLSEIIKKIKQNNDTK